MVCSGYGVVPVQMIWYYNFAMQVDKQRRTTHGDELVRAVVRLVGDYVSRGLRRDILASIAYNVFNIAPTGPEAV